MTPELALKAALRELEGYIKARENRLREARKLANSLKAAMDWDFPGYECYSEEPVSERVNLTKWRKK
jgi:hypothetical protein